jgi:hypothetical protein
LNIPKTTRGFATMPARKNDDRIPGSSSHSAERKSLSHPTRRIRERVKKEKKRVRFSEFDDVFEIPHIKDLSKQEIRDVWMADEDFKSIRQECMGAVENIGKGDVSDGFLLRGLDQHTLKYKAARESIGRKVTDVVLKIQEFERAHGVDASELMAKLCAKYSEPAVVAAQITAISDLFSCFRNTWSQRTIPTILAVPSATAC